jgi:protein MBA1
LTKKRPVTAKGTRKDAHNTPENPRKSTAKKVPRNSTMETANSASDPLPSAHLVEQIVQEDPKKQHSLSEEEKVEEMERMMAFAHLMPTVDPWGQEITETLGGPSVYS